MKVRWIAATAACGLGVAMLGLASTTRPAATPAATGALTSEVAAPARAAPGRYRASGPVILARNVFSAARRPPGRRFDPARGRVPEAPPPTLVLEGVVGGSVPSALIRIPSTEGARVVAPGEEVAGYRLVRVTSDAAVLAARGDTLLLSLGAPRP